MKLGFTIRKKFINFKSFLRKVALFLDYLIWLVFSLKKFSKKPKNPGKVLVIDMGGLGDSLNTFCIVEKLKKYHPDTKFYFIAEDTFRNSVEKYRQKTLNPYSPEFITKLKKNDFDLTVIICPIRKSRYTDINRDYLCFLKHIVGLETGGFRDLFSKNKFFLSRKIFPKFGHKIRERFRIFELAGFNFHNYKIELPENKEYKKEAERLVKKLKINNEKIIFFNPSSGTGTRARQDRGVPSHDWPSENFSKLAEMILKQRNTRILITGTREDKNISEEIIKKINKNYKKRVKSIAGDISFLGLGELMRKFKNNGVLVSIDTGTVHLGTSVDIPVIDLMGPYDPHLYCAWNPALSLKKSRAISVFNPKTCVKCRKYYCPEGNQVCMKSIFPEQIYILVKRFL
jgi:ADP-heptose:LPS heptosyltransferase